jgi:hypothetical protein
VGKKRHVFVRMLSVVFQVASLEALLVDEVEEKSLI